jgi:hypothetical protein
MRITWEVDDGYCGGGRPQHTDVDDDELAECDTDEERERLIEESVENDFDQNIRWCIISRD